jgi:DNA topoisomerase VI subunit B
LAMDERPNSFARKAFTISRLAEFVSESELGKQIGHPVADWPLVILKELVDNALDEAEEAGVPPAIEISVDDDSIIVHDGSGRGIPSETVEKLIDYSARTSSRAAYASPTRGAQGNALQTIIASPAKIARPWRSKATASNIALPSPPIRSARRPGWRSSGAPLW